MIQPRLFPDWWYWPVITLVSAFMPFTHANGLIAQKPDKSSVNGPEGQGRELRMPNSSEKSSSIFRLIGNDSGVKRGGIVYATGTGPEGEKYELKCDVYVPHGKGPFPAILAVHGGGWRSGGKWHMMRHAWKFMSKGFVVVAINYRHAPKHPFPAQIEDVKAATRWMRKERKHYRIDGDQIFAFGYSAGGHLVSLLGLTDENDGLDGDHGKSEQKISTRVKAVVAGGCPGEFSWIDPHSRALFYWMRSTRARAPERWRRASPTNYVSPDDPPFLFFHAKQDWLVPPSSSALLHEKLLQTGVISRRKVYSGYGHFSLFSNLDLVDEAADFYRETSGKNKN